MNDNEPSTAGDDESSDVVLVPPDHDRGVRWLAALASAGFDYRVRYRQGQMTLFLRPETAEAAQREIAEYERANLDWPPPAPQEQPASLERQPWTGATLATLVVLLIFGWTGPYDPDVRLFSVGVADSAKIMHGEWWRTLTTLTLHADIPHVLGNAVGCFFLIRIAAQSVGVGTAWIAIVLTGGGGNLAAAAFSDDPRISLGASTAVFGCLGLLAAAQFVKHLNAPGSLRSIWHRAWIPAIAGLGLLAFLGTGERADLAAHLLGFGIGAVAGALAVHLHTEKVPRPLQYAAHALCLILLAVAWIAGLKV